MKEKNNTNTITNSDYEELIKKTLSFEKNKENSIVEGKIISIDKNNVVIDVGLKVKEEYLYLNLQDPVKSQKLILVI